VLIISDSESDSAVEGSTNQDHEVILGEGLATNCGLKVHLKMCLSMAVDQVLMHCSQLPFIMPKVEKSATCSKILAGFVMTSVKEML
jgi:hypothetical protein